MSVTEKLIAKHQVALKDIFKCFSTEFPLAQILEGQMQTLRDKACPTEIIDSFEEQSQLLLELAALSHPKEKFPLVPVIPESYLGLYGLMEMLDNFRVNIKLGQIRERPAEPKKPYFLLGVNPASDCTRNYSPEDGQKKLKESERKKGLTIAEVIAVCLHLSFDKRSALFAAFPRYEKPGIMGPFNFLGISQGRILDHFDWDKEVEGSMPFCECRYEEGSSQA